MTKEEKHNLYWSIMKFGKNNGYPVLDGTKNSKGVSKRKTINDYTEEELDHCIRMAYYLTKGLTINY